MKKRPTQAAGDIVRYSMEILGARRGAPGPEGFETVHVETTRGWVDMRYYPAAGATGGVIFVGGAGGGFDTPVCGWLYPRLSAELQREGMAALRIQYRRANKLEECVLDVLAGVHLLKAAGVSSVALVGHSFGGAVVIQAAALSPAVRTCVPLSTQTYGADAANELGPRCSLLLAHGLDDEILPAECSRQVYEWANEPKRLLLKAGVRHGLDEWSAELPGLVREWIGGELQPRRGKGRKGLNEPEPPRAGRASGASRKGSGRRSGGRRSK